MQCMFFITNYNLADRLPFCITGGVILIVVLVIIIVCVKKKRENTIDPQQNQLTKDKVI